MIPCGIRPLVLGRNDAGEYGAGLGIGGADCSGSFTLRDVAPGEAVYITFAGELHSRQCAPNRASWRRACFEYVYFARPDSDHRRRLGTPPD